MPIPGLVLLLIFCHVYSLVSQSIIYEKYFQEEFGIESESLIHCKDGNYLISGVAYENSDVNYYLTKINQDGTVLEKFIFRDTVRSHLQSSLETKEGNYYFTGFSYYGDSLKHTTLCISNSGDSLWMKKHGMGRKNLPSQMIETEDDHLIIVGSIEMGSNSRKATMLKLTKDGSVIWEKVIGESSSENIALDVIELPDGGFFVSGWWRNGNSEGYLIRTDEEGNVIWDKKFTPSIQEVFTDLELSIDGNILVGGCRETYNYKRSPVLLKIDLDGNIIWEKIFPNMNIDTWGSLLDQDSNSNIFLTGSSRENALVQSWLIKLDQDGNEIYNHFYGDEKSDYIRALSILEDNAIGLLKNTLTQDSTTGRFRSIFYFIKIKDESSSQVTFINQLPKVEIRPNPGGQFAHIEIEEIHKVKEIAIHNNVGNNVYSISSNLSSSVRIELGNFPPGIYWVTIKSTGNQIITKKLLVSR